MTSKVPGSSPSAPDANRRACMILVIFALVAGVLAALCGLLGGLLFIQLSSWFTTPIATPTPTPTATVAASEVPSSHRFLNVGNLFVRWSQANPEEILQLSWKRSANLTNRYANSECPSDLEYFGNSWVSENEATSSFFFRSLVGYGSQGTWSLKGETEVNIESLSAGCPKSAGIPVHTDYTFFDDPSKPNLFMVSRTFDFSDTPFSHDIRPFIPRLYPRDGFSQVYYPNATSDVLQNHSIAGCGYGCRISDWAGTWFAIHDPKKGRGMLVQHVQTEIPVALWLDEDGGSFTNSSSVLLVTPSGGFTGSITETEYICFYDEGIWSPSLTLPPECLP